MVIFGAEIKSRKLLWKYPFLRRLNTKYSLVIFNEQLVPVKRAIKSELPNKQNNYLIELFVTDIIIEMFIRNDMRT